MLTVRETKFDVKATKIRVSKIGQDVKQVARCLEENQIHINGNCVQQAEETEWV